MWHDLKFSLRNQTTPYFVQTVFWAVRSKPGENWEGTEKVKLSASDTVSAQQGRLVFAHFSLSRPSKQVVTASPRRGALGDTKGQVCGSDPRHHLPCYPIIISITQSRNKQKKTEKVGEVVKSSDPTGHSYPSTIDSGLRLLPNLPRRARESQRASGWREPRGARRARGDELLRFMDGASKDPLHKVTRHTRFPLQSPGCFQRSGALGHSASIRGRSASVRPRGRHRIWKFWVESCFLLLAWKGRWSLRSFFDWFIFDMLLACAWVSQLTNSFGRTVVLLCRGLSSGVRRAVWFLSKWPELGLVSSTVANGLFILLNCRSHSGLRLQHKYFHFNFLHNICSCF